MAKQTNKKQSSGGRVNTQTALVVLLVVVVVFAGWLFYDNRQKARVPEAFQSPTGEQSAPPLPTELTIPAPAAAQ